MKTLTCLSGHFLLSAGRNPILDVSGNPILDVSGNPIFDTGIDVSLVYHQINYYILPATSGTLNLSSTSDIDLIRKATGQVSATGSTRVVSSSRKVSTVIESPQACNVVSLDIVRNVVAGEMKKAA